MNTTEFSPQKGEYVVYKKHGIYEITEIRRDKICNELKTYYILKSVYDTNATVYVPADKEELVSQMEKVLSKGEIDEIIKASKQENVPWIENNAQRFAAYQNIIAQGDLCCILSMMRMLASKKEEAIRMKTRIFAHDERMLSVSQKIISEAFAFSLGLERKEILGYIEERLS